MRSRTSIAATLALIGAMAAAPLSPVFAQTPMRDAPTSFRPLALQLTPAVVSVQVTTSPAARNAQRPDAPDAPQAPPGSPFEEFFRDFLERNRPPGQGGRPGPSPQQRRGTSLGSGFIIDAEKKFVVTNNHVVEGGTEINVVLNDNTTLPAELVGTDPRTDLALLRIKTDRQLTAVEFGNSDDAQVGDWVLAIGNPFGLASSVSAGIISARSRDIRQGLYDDFIQTDAAI
ncbi:MAG TPA: trypsin-like peptidase domain-containing protein, partial [Roseomonas sp.]